MYQVDLFRRRCWTEAATFEGLYGLLELYFAKVGFSRHVDFQNLSPLLS